MSNKYFQRVFQKKGAVTWLIVVSYGIMILRPYLVLWLGDYAGSFISGGLITAVLTTWGNIEKEKRNRIWENLKQWQSVAESAENVIYLASHGVPLDTAFDNEFRDDDSEDSPRTRLIKRIKLPRPPVEKES